MELIPTKSTFSIWWIQLVVFIIIFETFEHIFEIFLQVENCRYHTLLSILKGIACISGTCIFFGYFTFNFLFRLIYKNYFQYEIYIENFYHHTLTFYEFLLLDLFIHVFMVIIIYSSWKSFAYFDYHSIFGTFLFHRFWSLYTSQFKTIYLLEMKAIYRYVTTINKNLFRFVYLLEFIVILHYLFPLTDLKKSIFTYK